jgi:hypothetical protein
MVPNRQWDRAQRRFERLRDPAVVDSPLSRLAAGPFQYRRSNHMNQKLIYAMAGAALIGLAGCGMMQGGSQGASSESRSAQGERVTLSGKSEVPANESSATGSGTVSVAADGAVKVSVKVTGMEATAAHIHMAAAGANGPVIVPLEKQGTDTFVSKADAKMTAEQMAAYKAGRTYLNVHSAKLPGGEIRAQLKGS